MTPVDGPIAVAMLVQEGLFAATLRHVLGRAGLSVVTLGPPGSALVHCDPAPVAVLIEDAPEWLPVEECLGMASAAHPSAALILLVDRASPRQVEAWLSAGCRAVLGKEAKPEEVGLAIDAVRCGVPFVSGDVCPHLAV